MASERLTRHIAVAGFELRADGRTLVGIAVPYDAETPIMERGKRYTEVFRRGAFARTIAERGPGRVKLLVQHDREALPIGVATLLREDAAGLYAEFHVSATRAGDEILTLVTDGALDGLSVGFRPIRDRWSADNTRVERLEASLAEVSVTPFPAFAGAVITGVRALPTLSPELARRRLDLLERKWSR